MSQLESPCHAVIMKDVHLRLKNTSSEVHVLRGITLEICAGDTVSIVGPSGSGKTSLLLVLAGLEKPSSGSIIAGGNEITTLNEDSLALFRRNSIGLVFQDFHLVPTMTALENVALPLEFAGSKESFSKAKLQLSAVGLDKRFEHYPTQLSGGEQQRVALARAFVTEPAILLADEPTGNLDGKTSRMVIDALFKLQAQCRSTVLLVTHETSIAQRCARTIRLLDGRIVEGPNASPTVENCREVN